ncbi:MIP transporter [Trichodelitschia bisporula]|uniref:MIP transporter n=1 Tax=Trichodelitschia bisporula TaxID=703511 RepID=A0A6G1HRR0_9PEZI|nr:MIP transporter [Trichodelitschia bisporula]
MVHPKDLEGTMNLPPIQRSHSAPHSKTLNSNYYAGRIGGNQLYALSPSDANFGKVTLNTPDATVTASWPELLDCRGFREIAVWKMGVLEGVGTCLQTFISGLLCTGLIPTVPKTSVGPVFPISLAAIAQIPLISLFIYSAGPISGGHFNPLITLSTFMTKLTSLPRAILYVSFQCIGAVVGGFILRAALGGPKPLAIIPGCYVDSSLVKQSQAFALETVGALALIFLAFGLGLDPRNGSNPTLAPLFIGMASALVLFSTGIGLPGYTGASTNPARCLGLMAGAGRFTYHYVHWFGSITAALINALMYFAIPPYVDYNAAPAWRPTASRV